jgi:ATP-dependent DNA helicase RecG
MTDLPPGQLPTQRSATVEFRPEGASLGRLAEVLVAFANGGGGSLWVGVDGRTGQPQGLADPEATLDRALQAALSADPPLIIPLPRIVEVGDQPVLVVSVPPGLPHVYSYKGKYLVREGTRNRALAPRPLRRLMMERGAVSFESMVPDGARLDDLNWPRAEEYLAKLGPFGEERPEEALLQRGCLAEAQGEARPTYGGLLLFGQQPQRWVHSAEILLARYAGTRLGDQFVKEQVRGTLPEQIRRAEAFVRENIPRGARLSGLERIEETQVPLDAVREAIVNAVAHRDYQIRGDEIRVFLFRDRIEIYSPGRLPGHVTLDNLASERFSRNEVLVQVLSDMGFIERLGYGIDRMLRRMAEEGLPPPQFEETAGGFRVTLQGKALVGAEARLQRWRHLGLNERQEEALAYLEREGRITNRDYQELCPDVSAETIRRDLVDLVHKGLLIKIGDKRATYYILR